MGLTNMRERAEKLGGHLFIESTPGSGTVVRVQLPLNNQHNNNVAQKSSTVLMVS